MNNRLATLDDLSQLKKLYQEIAMDMNQNNLYIWDDVYPADFIEEDIVNKQFYLLEDGGEIVAGFSLSQHHVGANQVAWKDQRAKALYIDRFGVSVHHQHKGIAQCMLCEAKKLMMDDNAEYLRLFVVDANEPAICLYKKCGFQMADGVYEEIIDEDLMFHELGFEYSESIYKGEKDMNNIEIFWNEFLEAKKLNKETTYLESFHFEMSEHLANGLLELVLKGQKQATASCLSYYQITNERIPCEGDYSIITNWDGVPHCVIETTKVTVLPFQDITYEICKREGEDDTLESWRIGHEKFFKAEGAELGYEFSKDMLVLFEDFEVVFTKD